MLILNANQVYYRQIPLFLNHSLVWQSHNFIIPCITVEKDFIISTKFACNLYSLFYIDDEISAFILIVVIFLRYVPCFA